MQKSMIKDMLVIFLASLLIFICSSQSYPLLEPDEARYTEIPREMVVTGDVVVPRLNGVIYIEKPPLFYWLQAGSLALLGVTEGAARFWNNFFAAMTCAMVYMAGYVLYNRRTGWVAAALLFSSMLFYAMAHFITLDMTLSALMTGCLFFMLFGLEKPIGSARRWCFYASYIFAACALMTKGLVGILLPGSVFVLWILMTRRFNELKHIYLLSGLAIFFAIVLPWHVMMQDRVPQFFDFYIVGQHFRRYLTMAEKRFQPMWFFIPILLVGLLPWTVFALRALCRSFRELCMRSFKENAREVFLWVWFLFIFIFFSVSKSKLVPYILPVMPPITLLVARDLIAFSRARWEWVVTLVLVMIAGVVLAVYPFVDHLIRDGRAALFMPQFETLAVLLFLTFVSCVLLLSRRKELPALGALMLGTVGVFTLAIPLWSDVSDRSLKVLALTAKSLEAQSVELAAFGKYYQDLPVYAERMVTLVDKQDELDFGITIEDKSHYVIKQPEFWRRWDDPHHPMLVVVSQKKYDQYFKGSSHRPAKVLQRTTSQLLITNDTLIVCNGCL